MAEADQKQIHHLKCPSVAAAGRGDNSGADVQVITSEGISIPAHSHILASASPALERLLDRPWKRGGSGRVVPVLGVPSDAVLAFIGYLYSSKCSEEDMDKFGIHLLVLSHVYSIAALKRSCEKGLAARLTAENVVDILQLARLCDAPWLRVRCMKLVAKEFAAVEKSEGWRFLQRCDPRLELQLLQSLDEAESLQKRRMRSRRDEKLYLQLSEAMECLEHIYTEGCTSIGPRDTEPSGNKGPCKNFSTCQSLQLLICHFASCKRRASGGCSHCKRMWQLLRLHSSICDQPDLCKVPLCRQFKLKMEQVGDMREDRRWKLLVRKVVSAKAMSCLSKRKREEELDRAPWMIRQNGASIKHRSF